MFRLFAKVVALALRAAVLIGVGYLARMWMERRLDDNPAPAQEEPIETDAPSTPHPKVATGLSRSPVADDVITVHVDDLTPTEREVYNLDLAALERQLASIGTYFDTRWVESEPMDTEQIRQNLQNEENRLSGLRSDLREARELDADIQADELSVVDQHPADVGSEQAQKEVDLSLLEQIEAELSDVERAMRKLDNGTYGKCEVCNNQIDEARLEASPAARYCIDHAA